jgi:acyl-CoA reductase-like NAD-dependent aldehyde dehydrogenase
MDSIRRYSMFIGGDWVDADERFEIRSPATEELVASVAKGGREHADRAIAAAEYGLSAGVWSTDNERALDVARQLEAGTVWINDWHMVNAAYPFGGYKQSGLGRELGPHAFDEYTEEKFVHVALSGRLDRRAYQLLLSAPPD